MSEIEKPEKMERPESLAWMIGLKAKQGEADMARPVPMELQHLLQRHLRPLGLLSVGQRSRGYTYSETGLD